MNQNIQKLAIRGGSAVVTLSSKKLFGWPIITKEDEDAVLEVMRNGTASGTEITKLFEKEFAEWIGSNYALGTCNGTAALLAALWACGVGSGDEVICPSMTYWASALPAQALGASVNFADIEANSLCINPNDIEHRISKKTRAIIVVHYAGHPCDMDRIMPIARKHGIKVIEDVSHAQGSLYKGQMCGTIGEISAMSMMTGKSFAIGEGGMIVTDKRELFERCVAFGHYERTGTPSRFNPTDETITDSVLKKFSGAPIGGVKHRMNQMCSAMGRIQLKYYDERIAEIQKSLNYFWDQLDEVPGIRPHRPDTGDGSTMGGWYYPQGLYISEELGGLSCEDFSTALRKEGVENCFPGGNNPLHLHKIFQNPVPFHLGNKSVLSSADSNLQQGKGTLPVSEKIHDISFSIPWFKKYKIEIIDQYVKAFKKVCEYYQGIG